MIPRLVAQKKDLVFHEESVGTVICEIRPIFVRSDHFLFVCDVALWNFLVKSFGNFQDLVAVIEIAYMLQVIPKSSRLGASCGPDTHVSTILGRIPWFYSAPVPFASSSEHARSRRHTLDEDQSPLESECDLCRLR